MSSLIYMVKPFCQPYFQSDTELGFFGVHDYFVVVSQRDHMFVQSVLYCQAGDTTYYKVSLHVTLLFFSAIYCVFGLQQMVLQLYNQNNKCLRFQFNFLQVVWHRSEIINAWNT